MKVQSTTLYRVSWNSYLATSVSSSQEVRDSIFYLGHGVLNKVKTLIE